MTLKERYEASINSKNSLHSPKDIESLPGINFVDIPNEYSTNFKKNSIQGLTSNFTSVAKTYFLYLLGGGVGPNSDVQSWTPDISYYETMKSNGENVEE